MKYLIEKIDVDPLENSPSLAVWYDIVGYVDSEEQADKICKAGRIFTRDDCWAIYINLPEFKYKPIEKMESTDE